MTAPVANAAAGPRAGRFARLRRFGWRHPEWWVVLAAAAAWAWMAAAPHPRPDAHAHAGHSAAPGFWSGAPHLLVMVIAMMLPLTLASVRHVAFNSLWARRHRAIGGFVAGYLAVWMVAMLAIAGAWALAASLAGWTAAALVAMGAAVAWELAPARRRRLRRCTRTAPLAPRGWRADRDCARFGAASGASCVVACWALMAASAAFAHSLPVMAVLFGVQLSGRYGRSPSPALAAGAVLAVCLASLALRLAGGPGA